MLRWLLHLYHTKTFESGFREWELKNESAKNQQIYLTSWNWIWDSLKSLRFCVLTCLFVCLCVCKSEWENLDLLEQKLKKRLLQECYSTLLKGAFTHAVSTFWRMRFQFLNRNISIQNAMRCVFTLVTNLGLAQLALKTHAFSACVNSVSQLSLTSILFLSIQYITLKYVLQKS